MNRTLFRPSTSERRKASRRAPGYLAAVGSLHSTIGTRFEQNRTPIITVADKRRLKEVSRRAVLRTEATIANCDTPNCDTHGPALRATMPVAGRNILRRQSLLWLLPNTWVNG